MHDVLDLWQNPVTYAIPFFALTIGIELAALKWLDHDDNATGYAFRDAGTSILMGLGSLVTSVVLKVIGFLMYIWVWDHLALWHVPNTWWGILLGVVAVDLAYYWNHRFVHRARVGWAAHQAHHSSEYMNFATALRQKWNPWWELLFFLPLPFLGFSPFSIYLAFSINLIYQFYVHTETIGKLPRPIEAIFNTPSHHRVHHGSDPEYLDKNYAGILIIWDRMFGTFTPEVQRPTYGLTKPVTTHNLLTLEYGDYRALWVDVRRARSWSERLGYLFRPPGWAPEGEQPTPSRAIDDTAPARV
ncbi:sterol desaturase family protein [Nocardioides sp.]|uniref:sterol desaturase family protein n=1 Tax=Nocardioides sp. TaxID=35761 RepID=UPI00260686DF|nr:sterol desaturase family protein [Nocardioides sp.]